MFFKTYCGESNAETPIVKTTLKGSEQQRMEDFFLKTFQKKKQKIKKSSRKKNNDTGLISTNCKKNFKQEPESSGNFKLFYTSISQIFLLLYVYIFS